MTKMAEKISCPVGAFHTVRLLYTPEQGAPQGNLDRQDQT